MNGEERRFDSVLLERVCPDSRYDQKATYSARRTDNYVQLIGMNKGSVPLGFSSVSLKSMSD